MELNFGRIDYLCCISDELGYPSFSPILMEYFEKVLREKKSFPAAAAGFQSS